MNYIIGLFLVTSAFGFFALRWCFQQIHVASPNVPTHLDVVYSDICQAHSVLAMFDTTTGMQLEPESSLGFTVGWRDWPDSADAFSTLCKELGIRPAQKIQTLLQEAVDYCRDQFDGDSDDLSVSGSDLVDWFTNWRDRARALLLAMEAKPRSSAQKAAKTECGSIYIEATNDHGEIIRQYHCSAVTPLEDATLMTGAVELRDGAERQGCAFFCGIIAPWQLRVLKLLGVKPLRW